MEILASRGISIIEDAYVSLVEKGLDLPEKGIAVAFDPLNLDELLEFLDEFKPAAPSWNDTDTIVGKRNDSYEIIKLNDIFFFEADDNDTFCQTRNNKYEIKKKLYELESGLNDKGFIRVNKSYLINILMVSEIIPWFGGRLLLKFKDLKAEVEVSRKNVPLFKNYIDM
jgi:Response regulator of the LytR/AlgR family